MRAPGLPDRGVDKIWRVYCTESWEMLEVMWLGL